MSLTKIVGVFFCVAKHVHHLPLNKESRKNPKHLLGRASAKVSNSSEVVANELSIFSHQHKGKKE